MLANTIDDVIQILDDIITENKANNNPLGYFAALYQKVTINVKQGIQDGFFDDSERMEKLDVIFANRYLEAYFDYQNNKTITQSWQKTFDQANDYWPTVLQHLLLGMNAHINLDLGIAAAETAKGRNIDELEGDFMKINQVLSSLVQEVEKELSTIWPTLKRILKFTRKVDDFLVDFSMELARDGAWEFAKEVYVASPEEQARLMTSKDEKISKNTRLIVNNGFIAKTLFAIMRIGEKGTVADKIGVLEL